MADQQRIAGNTFFIFLFSATVDKLLKEEEEQEEEELPKRDLSTAVILSCSGTSLELQIHLQGK